MRPSLIATGGGLLVVLAALLLCPGTLQAVPDFQLLVNPGMEIYDPPYAQYQGVDCQVALGWQRFWYNSPEPVWMDTRVFDRNLGCNCWVERIEGSTSQLLFSTEPYTAGLQQQVTGLLPGVGYGFHAAMLTIFQTSAGGAADGTMIKQIGIDPTGGSDPRAPTVVWSEPDDHDEGPWDIDQRVAAFAESPTMTVFIRVISPYPAGQAPYLNLSFLDSAILAQTPTVRASSPPSSEEPTFLVEWDNVEPAPGGAELRWLEVQWLDEAEGLWHDWLLKTDKVREIFTGEMGHAYRFRARAFQKYPNGAHLYSPYRAWGDTRTRLGGPLVTGTVMGPQGERLSGATVGVQGSAHAATSGWGGFYNLELPVLTTPQTLVVSHPDWLDPAPVYGVFPGPTETVTVDWILRPPDDLVLNGGFEWGLEGWATSAKEGIKPSVVKAPVHSGYGAAALGGEVAGAGSTAVVSTVAGISQTTVLTDAWEPVLSFLYRAEPAGSGDGFRVVLTVVTETISTTVQVTGTVTPTIPVSLTANIRLPLTEPITSTPPVTEVISSTVRVTTTQVFSPPLSDEGWQHAWYFAGPQDAALTGTVTVDLEVWNDGDGEETRVYVDEVSLGATAPPALSVYLPLVLKKVGNAE